MDESRRRCQIRLRSRVHRSCGSFCCNGGRAYNWCAGSSSTSTNCLTQDRLAARKIEKLRPYRSVTVQITVQQSETRKDGGFLLPVFVEGLGDLPMIDRPTYRLHETRSVSVPPAALCILRAICCTSPAIPPTPSLRPGAAPKALENAANPDTLPS